MSDNIPFDIQMQIIKNVYEVRSLIRFRSVSKQWKSFIDSSEFINGYDAGHSQPHSCILRNSLDSVDRFVCSDDKNETFKVRQQEELAPFVMCPLVKNYSSTVVGACHGLLCLYGRHNGYNKWMFVIWNPSIGKSFGIADDALIINWEIIYGFGVCPVTKDPTVVKINCRIRKHWHVEVFTLSSGVWNVIPTGNLPRQSIRLSKSPQTHVVIDRFIYWGATSSHAKHIVSFDLSTKEFKVIDLPDSLSNELNGAIVCVSKLRESPVVYGIYFDEAIWCGVWVMEHDSSFRKLFTIDPPVEKILGFKTNGETIFLTRKEGEMFRTLYVYDPCSQQIKNLGISRPGDGFFMDSYKESLLLLDHSDLHIYSEDS